MLIHNQTPAFPDSRIPTYSQDVQTLKAFLQAQGTFHFPVLETGLFPAAHLSRARSV